MLDKVAVIILNYNNYQDTIECIQGLQAIYNEREIEIIVVDNNSQNDSVKQLEKKLKDITIIASTVNKGYAHGNNIGLKNALAQGYDYLCILNNDTVIEEDFLSPCIEYLEGNSKVGFISPALVEYKQKDLVQSTGGDIFINKGIVTLKNYHKFLSSLPRVIESDYIGGACMVFRSSLIDQVGLIPEIYFLFFEETEWCYRAKKKGFNNVCLTNIFIQHKGSVSIQSISGLQAYLMERNRVVFVKRNIDSHLKFTRFLIYIYLRTIFRIVIGKEKNWEKILFYTDGLLNRVNKNFSFIDI